MDGLVDERQRALGEHTATLPLLLFLTHHIHSAAMGALTADILCTPSANQEAVVSYTAEAKKKKRRVSRCSGKIPGPWGRDATTNEKEEKKKDGVRESVRGYVGEGVRERSATMRWVRDIFIYVSGEDGMNIAQKNGR